MYLAIYGSRHQDRHIGELRHFFDSLTALAAAGTLQLAMEERFYSYVSQLLTVDRSLVRVFQHLDEQPDMVLSIGGDGTFLRVAKALGRYAAPILGINTGHLGFLSAACIEGGGDDIVRLILEGDYRVEERTMLRVSSEHPEFRGPRYALNEVAVLRRDNASMISIEARLGGEPLANYRADGLIVATPTGSTGYNLSVGGPIVSPSTPCFIIAPIAPHSLNMRPIVVSDRERVELHSEGRADTLLLNLDGKAVVLPINASITITRAGFPTRVVIPRGESFIHTLRTKLLWGATNED